MYTRIIKLNDIPTDAIVNMVCLATHRPLHYRKSKPIHLCQKISVTLLLQLIDVAVCLNDTF